MNEYPLSNRMKQKIVKEWANKKATASKPQIKEVKPTMPKTQAAHKMPGINAPSNTEIVKSIFKKKSESCKAEIKKQKTVKVPKNIFTKKIKKDYGPGYAQYSSVKVNSSGMPKAPKTKMPRTLKPRVNKPMIVTPKYGIAIS